MATRSQYVLMETLISVAINTALSIGFVFLVFHGQSWIAINGIHGMVFDMAPQTFMVTLMSCLVPGLLTRTRLAAGKLAWQQPISTPVVTHLWLRSAILAVLTTTLVVAFSWAIFPHLFPAGMAFPSLLVYKAVFGMLLAASVTPWAIARVLR